MAAGSSSSKTEEIIRETDLKRSALIGWTSIEEVQNTVQPYVSKVIKKSCSGGYTSASEVLEDYKTFKALHKTLVKAKDKLFIDTYVDEYVYHYALYVKAEMLCAFPYLLLGYLQDRQRKWINDQLRRIGYKYDELRSDSLGYLLLDWEMPIEQLGKDARREIREQTIEKSMHFKKYQNDWGTHADKIDKKMREFEELESEISGMKNDLVLRCRHSSTYYKTWHDVEDGFHKLEKVFFQLLPDGGEMDLAKKWSAVKLGVEELVGK